MKQGKLTLGGLTSGSSFLDNRGLNKLGETNFGRI